MKRGIQSIILILYLTCFFSCNDNPLEKNEYVFVKKYCTNVTLGGVVGIKKQCYEIGEEVLAVSKSDTTIKIRIANGPQINNTPGPWSFQEFLEIPLDYLSRI